MIRFVLLELGMESMHTLLKLNRTWNDKVCSVRVRYGVDRNIIEVESLLE